MTQDNSLYSIKYNDEPIISGNQTIWFLNGDLVRVHHSTRSSGTIVLFNIIKNEFQYCLKSDFIKNREKAYTVAETAKLINRHRKYIPDLIKRGVIPPPVGSQPGGETKWQVRAYYSESTVKEIRDTLATIHIGRPRQDGFVTNNLTPNTQELTRRMGEGILTYTRTEDGRYIPIWSESI